MMKQRIKLFLETYLLIVVTFVIQKPLFMFYYHNLYTDTVQSEWWQVVLNGLKLDCSLAGYLTVLPGLMLIVSNWVLTPMFHKIWKGYFLFISLLLSLIFMVDLGLYEYWGFRLDATPLFYFFSSPKDAIASVSVWVVIGALLAFVCYAACIYGVFFYFLCRKQVVQTMRLPYRRVSVSLVTLLLTALLFIPIRGGFTVSTMNTGKVYFSQNLRLNHAATNPAFSLMESLSKQKDFASQYRYVEPAVADSLFAEMVDPQVLDSTLVNDALQDTLLNTDRPNILIVIMESFSSYLMESLGGEPNIAVNLDELASKGILFTNFYANSFRTDRGLVSILSGYPAQPSTSLMKYPRKTQHLPSICGSLKKAGYEAHYYYGGDADFTNMRSYLMSSGFESIVSDQDFPVGDRLSKWGVHDHLLFNRLYQDLAADTVTSKPRFRVLQTSSSHEPFEVPYRRLENNRLNAFAYTDSCIGAFVRQFEKLPQWKNTLMIMVPDHLGCYPENISNLCVERYQVPLIMIGGAVRQPRKIDVFGSQHDIAATLLAQLGLPHHDFKFSKDLLKSGVPHFAFFTVPDAFGLVDEKGRLIFDCQGDRIAVDDGETQLQKGQTYLQKLYDDIAER